MFFWYASKVKREIFHAIQTALVIMPIVRAGVPIVATAWISACLDKGKVAAPSSEMSIYPVPAEKMHHASMTTWVPLSAPPGFDKQGHYLIAFSNFRSAMRMCYSAGNTLDWQPPAQNTWH